MLYRTVPIRFLAAALAAGLLSSPSFGSIPAAPPASVPPGRVRSVTLEQALAEARANNALLQAAREEVRASEGVLKEARSYFLPDLAVSESFSRTDNPVYVFMGKLTQERFGMMDFAIDSLNQPRPLTNYRSRVELTLPLFAGGKIRAGYRAAKLGAEASRGESAFAESSVVKGVTEAYYGSMLALRAAAVMEETVRTAKAHLAQVEAMHEKGLVLDSDLLRMKVFVSDMEQREVSTQADSQVAAAYLGYAMGTEEDVVPAEEFSPPSTPLPTFGEARKWSLDHRGDLRAMTLKTSQAKEGVTMARAGYLPQVGLMASYEQDTERWTPGTSGDNWMVGVQLRLPLFDGGARAGKLQTARSREIQAGKALLDLQQKISVEVKSALLRARAAAQRVAVTTQSEAQARENRRIIALRYKEGLASITDLLDADTALTAAALQRSKALHDELVARARLDWAMGKS